VNQYAPAFVFLGVAGAVALGLIAFWDRVMATIGRTIEPLRLVLERAAIRIKAEELAFIALGCAIVPWGILVLVLRPGPLIGILLLAASSVMSFFGMRAWVNFRVARRLASFNNQLETALRLVGGALRVGLGLRQALVTVVMDMPDPARMEFMRVLSQTQIGVGIYDALDQLAERMPSGEMSMFTRAVRVQSQTGGNLTRVLENLADTIKQRRRIARKIRALTSEAVTTKYIITALPVAMGVFIMTFEPDMRAGLLFTTVGQICLAVVVSLLVSGWLMFGKLSQLDI
jgi:tight adherence protein B